MPAGSGGFKTGLQGAPMKFVTLLTVLLIPLTAISQSTAERIDELPSPHYGTYVFHVLNPLAGQAVNYIDETRLPSLFLRLAAEPGVLRQVITEVYHSYDCDPDGSMRGEDEFYCGDLNGFSRGNTVLWSYGRGGWAAGGATYRTFLTFTLAGTGRFTEMALVIESSIEAAVINEDGVLERDETPIFEVVYRIEKARILNADGTERVVPLQ